MAGFSQKKMKKDTTMAELHDFFFFFSSPTPGAGKAKRYTEVIYPMVMSKINCRRSSIHLLFSLGSKESIMI